MCVPEGHPLDGHPVEVGGGDLRALVEAAQVTVAHVVGQDVHDVGPVAGHVRSARYLVAEVDGAAGDGVEGPELLTGPHVHIVLGRLPLGHRHAKQEHRGSRAALRG